MKGRQPGEVALADGGRGAEQKRGQEGQGLGRPRAPRPEYLSVTPPTLRSEGQHNPPPTRAPGDGPQMDPSPKYGEGMLPHSAFPTSPRISKMAIIGRPRMNRKIIARNRPIVPRYVAQSQIVG